MDLAGVSPASISATQTALTLQTAGVLVMRKVLDLEAAQGAMLVQLMNQSGGLGQSMDVSA